MSSSGKNSSLWYTRRGDVERGPYPAWQISRYILLGRIGDQDQLRCGGGDWQSLQGVPQLIPEVMKLPPGEENERKLLLARMEVDERQPGDRRDRQGPLPSGVKERRSGRDRRQPESDFVLRHRQLKHQAELAARRNTRLYTYPAVVLLLLLAGFLTFSP